MSLKLKIKSWKTSKNPLQWGIYRSAWLCKKIILIGLNPVRFIFKPEFRAQVLLKYTQKEDVHQIVNHTGYNRYPDLFSVCRNVMAHKKNIKILSFGCSTGEEVLSLRKYFPEATIIGVDINKRNIKKAKQHDHDNKIIFSHNVMKTIKAHGPFHIIFALAVLQRTENRNATTTNSSKIYPFEKFNETVGELDHNLKPTGLFVIDHSDYLLEAADIASNYLALQGEHTITHERYLFDNNNQRMPEFVKQHRIYIKHEMATP